MKVKHLRWLSAVLAFVLLFTVFSAVGLTAYAVEEDAVTNTKATVQFIDGEDGFELRITNYKMNGTGLFADMINEALQKYNTNHSTEKVITDATKLTVVGMDDEQYLIGYDFNVLRQYKVDVLDISGVNFAQGAYHAGNLSDENKNVLKKGVFTLTTYKEVRLPKNLKVIENEVFRNFTNLERIEFPPNLIQIGTKDTVDPSDAGGTKNPNRFDFYNCPALKEVICHSDTYSTDIWNHLLASLVSASNFDTMDISRSNVSLDVLKYLRPHVNNLNLMGCNGESLGTEANGYTELKAWLDTTAIKAVLPNGDIYPDPLIFKLTNTFGNGSAYISAYGDNYALTIKNYANIGRYDKGNHVGQKLMTGALANYNALYPSAKVTKSDIVKITYSNSEDGFISQQEREFLKNQMPHVKELDFTGCTFCNTYTGRNPANDNILGSNIFGSGSRSGGTALAELEKLTLPESVTTISSYAFTGCTSLKYIDLSHVTTFQDGALRSSTVETIVLGDNFSMANFALFESGIKNIVYTGGDEITATYGTNNEKHDLVLYCANKAAASAFCTAAGITFTFKNTVYVENAATMCADKTNSGFLAPAKEGKLFAGWFADEAKTELIAEDTQEIYAKYIDSGLLKIWGQKKAADGKSTIRFVSTVDDLNYEEVGFVVSLSNKNPEIGGQNCKQSASFTVYTSVKANGHLVAPSTLHTDSGYMFCYTLKNIPEANNATPIYIRAYYKTLDGTVVYGNVITTAACNVQ